MLFFVFVSLQGQVSQAYSKEATVIEQVFEGESYTDVLSQESNISGLTQSIEEKSGGLNTSQPPSIYAPLWGDDLLVTNECPVHTNVTRLAFDYDDNGYIYVALLSYHGANDTIWIYRSTDMGYTWNKDWSMWFQGTGVNVLSYDMRVQANTPNPYIYTVAVYIYGNDTLLSYRRVKADHSTYDWYHFSSTTYNDINWVEMDITDEADPHIYVVFTVPASPWRIYRCASADGGATWSINTLTSNQITPYAFDVCAGPDDYAYIINHFTGNNIRVSRYNSYFGHWIDHITIGTDANFQKPVVASARHNAYPANYVHAVYQSGHIDVTTTRSIEYVSSDGGATYTGPGFFILGDVHAVSPFVACTRYGTSDQFIGIATQYWTDADSTAIGYKYDQTQPWNNLGFKNQYRATTGIAPQGNYVNSGLGGGIAYVYRQYASNNIWYDRASHYNAVEENPSPVTGITYNPNQIMFSFSLPNNTSGTIAVYDMLGRNVVTLYSGDFNAGENSFTWDYKADGISSGNYFMMLSVPGKTLSEKISIVN